MKIWKIKMKKAVLLPILVLIAFLLPHSVFAYGATTGAISGTISVDADMPAATVFSLDLKANDPENPMPAISILTLTAKEIQDKGGTLNKSFGEITFSDPGDYYYTLVQTGTAARNVYYDTEQVGQYTILVHVIDEDMAEGGMAAVVMGWKGKAEDRPDAGEKPDEFLFKNEFRSPGLTGEKTAVRMLRRGTGAVVTGDNSNLLFLGIFLTGALVLFLVLLAAVSRHRRQDR